MIEGNRAWRAAAEVRQRWLASQLLARRSAPREADVFIATQLLTMPRVLRPHLAAAPEMATFAALTGQPASQAAAACAAAAARKLPLPMLAPIITAYEHALSAPAGGQDTWRTDRPYSPCPRAEAGAYFTFLASTGYQLSAVERAVADGTPYTGDTPAEDTLAIQPAGAHDDQDDPAGHDDPAGTDASDGPEQAAA